MLQENDCLAYGVLAAQFPGAPEGATLLSDERHEELKGVLTVDAGKVESHLAGKVRQAVEEVLNDLLDAEADERCGQGESTKSSVQPLILPLYFAYRSMIALIFTWFYGKIHANMPVKVDFLKLSSPCKRLYQ